MKWKSGENIKSQNMKNIIERGKELAYLLRHDKSYKFDEHGWRTVDDLIRNHGYTIEELDEIVETNNKKRYEYSEDKKLIRARQGHSINVDVELVEKIPPKTLYHGTAERFVPSIMCNGIVKGTRLHVHLSETPDVAKTVGQRHGKPAVLEIDTESMSNDGCKFWLSNNGVWLTEYVDTKYITLL
jgi:putative RNA 2'-phosphotransferase